MKKLLSLVLCFVFAFSLTACKKDKNETLEHSVDIANFVANGQISDVEYKLGDNVEEVEAALSKAVNDHGESSYFDYTAKEYTIMTDGVVCCCYKTDDMSDGLSHIVKYGDAYGFAVGTVSTQLRDTMSKMGFDAKERDAKQGELFFVPSSNNMTVLEYKIEGVTVLFAFQESALSATVIYK